MILEVRENTELKNVLKLASLVESGGVSKHLIKDGEVKLNGIVETRVSKKVEDGDIVEYSGEIVEIKII
ncbi:MAG: RNA-binding S4 domain-containing protein [Ezakiella sp.]|nr:RNA-binding S4 domain-containing protein [Ezakiella sp.]MDD7762266.1 RNA-binding S4 domain-containing protein [Bacillota bacterium]MDY3947237.1 RNA-binding S4 domain-containing protein [Ezakiella sp.]